MSELEGWRALFAQVLRQAVRDAGGGEVVGVHSSRAGRVALRREAQAWLRGEDARAMATWLGVGEDAYDARVRRLCDDATLDSGG